MKNINKFIWLVGKVTGKNLHDGHLEKAIKEKAISALDKIYLEQELGALHFNDLLGVLEGKEKLDYVENIIYTFYEYLVSAQEMHLDSSGIVMSAMVPTFPSVGPDNDKSDNLEYKAFILNEVCARDLFKESWIKKLKLEEKVVFLGIQEYLCIKFRVYLEILSEAMGYKIDEDAFKANRKYFKEKLLEASKEISTRQINPITPKDVFDKINVILNRKINY